MTSKADSPKKKPASKADGPAGKDIRGFVRLPHGAYSSS